MTQLQIPNRLHVVKDPAPPGTPEWERLVTASKVAGIVGESAYATPYSVWNTMRGIRVEPSGMEDRFLTGHAMEHALAYWWAEKNPDWRLSRGEVQVTNPHLPFPNAATLDRIATRKGHVRSPKHSRCVQFKTVSDWEEYQNLTPETIPADWLVQETIEMLFSGLVQLSALIVVCGPFYEWKQLEVPWLPEFAIELVESTEHHLELEEPPAPTAPNDYKIAKLRHPDIDDDAAPVTIDADTAAEWDAQKTAAKLAGRMKRTADKHAEVAGAKLLEAMGTAATAINPDGYVIAKRVATKKGVQLRHVPLPEEK